MSQPFLVVVAGPNGSGKTTLTDKLRASSVDLGEYVNADEIALTLFGSPAEVAAKAQAIAEHRREMLLKGGHSFTFETVMSHPSKVEFMRRARDAGYRVILYFVATDLPEINVSRVQQRVHLGGHDVPKEKIVARYERTLQLLVSAVEAAHEGALFDNSSPTRTVNQGSGAPMKMVVSFQNLDGSITYNNKSSPLPGWIDNFFVAKLR